MKVFRVAVVLTCILAVSSASAAQRRTRTPPRAVTVDVVGPAITALNQYKSVQQAAQVQDPDLAYGMRKALVIADLLLDANGKINTSLCQTAKAAFVPKQPLKYEENIGHFLDQFDASWQPFFDNISLPQQPSAATTLLIKAFFGLSPKDAVTDRHAKVAVLAAMLAPYNQGAVGDCFAVADLVRDHQEYYKHTANDLADIVLNGFIPRTIGKQTDNFFFLPTLADPDLTNAISVDASGKVQGSTLSLFDVPGFAAASSVMGGTGVKNLLQGVLSQLAAGAKSQLSPAQVVDAMAQVISQSSNVDKDTLAAQGMYAFSCLTNNPVLRGAECAYAAMAEDVSQDYVRGSIDTCLSTTLQPTFNAMKSKDLAKQFATELSALFDHAYRLVYNPNIPLAQVSADGSSTDGGYQLFKRTTNPNELGTPVVTPQDFEQLVLEVIDATETALGSTTNVPQVAAKVKNYVKTDAFLKEILWSYDNANRNEKDPIANYQRLSSTPMLNCTGDNPYAVSDVDTGTAYDKDVVTFTPSNTLDLVKWCLDLSKKAPQELIPMNSPQHAFNFDPTNADIVAFKKSGKSSDYWVKQKVSVPGVSVATKAITSATQDKLSAGVLEIVQELLQDASAYHAMVNKLNQKKLTVQNYAQGLLDGVCQLIKLDADQMNELARLLDGRVIKSLSANDQIALQQSAIRFAFTNWNDGTKDIYFCAYLNPRTLHVAFAIIDEDKTNLSPMDETAWINNQQWDVDLKPYAPKQAILTATGS